MSVWREREKGDEKKDIDIHKIIHFRPYAHWQYLSKVCEGGGIQFPAALGERGARYDV